MSCMYSSTSYPRCRWLLGGHSLSFVQRQLELEGLGYIPVLRYRTIKSKYVVVLVRVLDLFFLFLRKEEKKGNNGSY